MTLVITTHPELTATDENGNDIFAAGNATPLHRLAQIYTSEGIFATAVRQGYDINALNEFSLPPIAYAILSAKRYNIAQMVAAGAELCFTNPDGKTFNALNIALLARRKSTVLAVLQAGGDAFVNTPGYLPNGARADLPPLFLAIQLGYDELIPDLIAAGALLNKPLASTGQTPLDMAAKLDNLGALRKLLQHGADLEHPMFDGQTALFSAIGHGKAAAMELLLKAGANPDARDRNGLTPLHWATVCERPELAEILIKWGADSSLRDDFNRSAADITDMRLPRALPLLGSNLQGGDLKPSQEIKAGDIVLSSVLRKRGA